MQRFKKKYVISSILIITLIICLVIYFIFFRANIATSEDYTEYINREQWGLMNVGQNIEGIKGLKGYDINAFEAWKITKGEQSILVGVLDTGIEISNPAIKDRIFKNSREIDGNGIDDDKNGYIDDTFGWDFMNNDNTVYDGDTYDYHGTFIASLIAGQHNDTNKVWGVAPNVTVVPLKFLQGSSGSIDSAIEAIEYGYNLGVRIFNASWDTNVYDEDLFRTMQKYHDAIFITSSGKGKYNVEESSIYPCNFDLDNIVCVSAVDNTGELEEYSGYGGDLVSAPGVNIYGVLPNGEYTFSNGTSFATAYVTGIAALAKSIDPNIKSDDLVKILRESKKTLSRNDNTLEIIDTKKVLEMVAAKGR